MALGDIYVVNAGGNSIQAIDPATDTLRGTAVALGSSPRGAAWCSSNSTIYVASASDNKVYPFDPAAGTTGSGITVGTSPLSLCYAPNVNRLYVPNSGGTTVSVINPATNGVVATIGGFGTSPWGAVYAPTTGNVWVSCNGSTRIDEIDTSTNTRTGTTISTAGASREMTFCYASMLMYVPTANATTQVQAISPVTKAVIANIGSAPNNVPGGACYAQSARRVYVVNNAATSGSKPFSVNPYTNAFVASVDVGASVGQAGIEWSDVSGYVYVSTAGANTVKVINPVTDTVVTTITGLNYPWGVVRAKDFIIPTPRQISSNRTQAVVRAAVF